MGENKTKTEKVALKAQLRGDVREMFLELKKWYGVDADAELARILIRNQYRILFEKPSRAEEDALTN